MKQVIKYISFDGVQFDSEIKCLDHESYVQSAKNIMSILKPVPNDDGFYNGHSFVSHWSEDVIGARRKLIVLCAEITGDPTIKHLLDHRFLTRTYATRMLSEVLTPSIYKMWCRFENMDEHWREWGQQYFAINPDESPALKGGE